MKVRSSNVGSTIYSLPHLRVNHFVKLPNHNRQTLLRSIDRSIINEISEGWWSEYYLRSSLERLYLRSKLPSYHDGNGPQ